jgi:flagellar biogenesis protein FliO
MAGAVMASVAAAAMFAAGPGPWAVPARPAVLPNQPVSVEPVAHAPAVDIGAREAEVPPASVTESEPAQVSVQVTVPAQEALPLGGAAAGGAEGAAAAEHRAAGWWGSSGVVQAVASTGAVVVLIFGARWLLVRGARSAVGSASVRSQLGAGGRAPSGLLFVLGRYPVSRGSSLVLIQLDRRVLLLSQSGAGFQTLAEVTDAEEVASIIGKARDEEGESLSARFSTLLRTFDKRHVESERTEDLRSVVRRGGVGTVEGAEGDAATSGVGDDTPEAIRDRLSALRALVS